MRELNRVGTTAKFTNIIRTINMRDDDVSMTCTTDEDGVHPAEECLTGVDVPIADCGCGDDHKVEALMPLHVAEPSC